MTTIGSKMAVGATWMVLAKLLERSLGLLSTLILARVLVPHDFGIVAMAMSFVALLEMLGAFGFDVALIQKQTTDRRYWDTVWTLEIMLGAIVATGMIVGSHAVADFFNEPALVSVLCVLAIGSIAQGCQNVGLVAFRTEMRFDSEFRFLIAKKLISFFVTIPLAIILDSYWALVIGQTVGRAAGTILSYWVHPYRPRISFGALRELFHFSKWLLLNNLVVYLKERSSDWVIGRTAGPAALGTFNVSYEIASLPSTELAAPINRAVFPAYAQLAIQGREALGHHYLSVIGLIVLLTSPAIMGIAATARLLVPVIMGPNWSQAIPVLTLLGFFGFINIVQSNAYAAYVALGRVDVPAKLNGLQVALQVAALIVLTNQYGLIGAATGFLVTGIVMIPVNLAVVLRMLRIPAGAFLQQTWRPICAATIMFALVHEYVLTVGSVTGIAAAGHLIAAVTIGMLVYVSGVTGLWLLSGRRVGAEAVVLRKVKSVVMSIMKRGRASSERPAHE